MNQDEKTLVILTPGFPSSEVDTICLPMQQSFVRCITRLYPDIRVIVMAFQYPYFTKTYDWNATTVISFGGRNRGGLSKLLLRRKLYSSLREMQRTNNVIGLLSFWYGECALVGKSFAAKNNLRHYCWLMGQDAKNSNKYPRLIRPKPDELIAISNFIQDEFERNHGIRPKYVVPPGIDTSEINSIPVERDIDILAAGSLIPLKQFEMLPGMITRIKQQIPGIRAWLVGDGAGKQGLNDQIIKMSLQENLVLTGEIPHPELMELMRRTKVFLHPSNYEGFSGVCLEAWANGARVISFCRPMKRDIENWDIVATQEEMTLKALMILKNAEYTSNHVKEFQLNHTVKNIMQLFPE